MPGKPLDTELTVTEDEDGCRLDIFLARQYAGQWSRSLFKRMIRESRVLVNGRAIKPGHEVRRGDAVTVRFPGKEIESSLTPLPMKLEVLFEDEDILVVNKAPGVVVHPGAGHEEATLVHGLLAHCSRLASQGSPQRPGIVHRLDKDTSGALVVAKTESAYLDLIEQFKEHRVRKEYLALVYGRLPTSSGEIRTLMDRHAEDRKKMAVVQGRGREAVSRWQLERDWKEISLLRVDIETGRTHQIRVHLSHLQHPVVGDSTYGGGARRARSVRSKSLQDLLVKVERQMLHARRLSFRHPGTSVELSIEAPLPADFSDLLREMDRWSRSPES